MDGIKSSSFSYFWRTFSYQGNRNRNHRTEHALIPRDFSLVTLPLAVSSGYANHSGVRPRAIIGSSPMISLVLDWRVRKARSELLEI